MTQHFDGTWRSYKAFYHSGQVKKHNAAFFLELRVNEHELLTLKNTDSDASSSVIETTEWEIKECGKSKYPYIKNKQAFEIITLEIRELILTHLTTERRFFCTCF